jgi:hypothetical protein
VVWMRPAAYSVGVDKVGMGSRCGVGGGQCGRKRAPELEEARWAAAGAVGRGGACPNLSEWVRAGMRGR